MTVWGIKASNEFFEKLEKELENNKKIITELNRSL
jgi:hypothetical protein